MLLLLCYCSRSTFVSQGVVPLVVLIAAPLAMPIVVQRVVATALRNRQLLASLAVGSRRRKFLNHCLRALGVKNNSERSSWYFFL